MYVCLISVDISTLLNVEANIYWHGENGTDVIQLFEGVLPGVPTSYIPSNVSLVVGGNHPTLLMRFDCPSSLMDSSCSRIIPRCAPFIYLRLLHFIAPFAWFVA